MSSTEGPLPPSVPTGGAVGNNATNNRNTGASNVPTTSSGGNINSSSAAQQVPTTASTGTQMPGQNVRVTATIRTQNIPTNNNNGEVPQQTQNLFHMRDRLFLALFFRVSLIYARACPKTFRRILEFCLLVQSISLLFMLGYIHVAYTRSPITCLADYKNSWPRDGILRVEITTESAPEYDLKKSYEKEERLRQRAASSQMGHYSDDFLSMMFAADT